MSLQRLSPTANLFRTSRLFSLPPPLPRPSPDFSAISTRDSDTATTPYPTHAAIETTQSSLGRGDWGLKRALPLKSTTRTSTPVIHIDNIDSIDHITDFNSAADHAITLRKWQELDMPISLADKRKTASTALPPARSVFDSNYDNTDAGVTKSMSRPGKERWKFNGPWLAGKTDGEFNDYVEKKVKRRKLDFRRYLGEHLAQIKETSRRREAVERGEDLEALGSDEVTVSDEEIGAYMRHLRNNEMDLHKLVEVYLDLPREEGEGLGGTSSQYDEKGPPTTHPSAGLSYLRTDSHIYNHPDLGPQENKAPTLGRVIVPQKSQGKTNAQALIGVAGVVSKDLRKTFFKEGIKGVPGVSQYDPDIPGGGKLWAHPRRASINSHGRIDLVVDRADKNALNVAMGVHSEVSSEGPTLPPAAIAGLHDRQTPTLTPTRPMSSGSTSGYGLEDMEGVRMSGRADPFLGPDDKAPQTALSELLRAAIRPGK